jgi:hypothetical protein
MKCALKRFGPGIPNTKTNLVSKEVNNNLQKMMEEREKQDKMWDSQKKNEICRDVISRTINK